MPCLLVIIAIIVESTKVVLARTDTSLLPSGWDKICQSTSLVTNDLNASFKCFLSENAPVKWRLADLRQTLETKVSKVSFEVKCEYGTSISLPWPMRAPGLVELRVRDCDLLDHYAEFQTSAEKLSDSLRVLDMQHCRWLIDLKSLIIFYDRMKSMSSEFNCGQDSSLVKYITRNISTETGDLSKSLSKAELLNMLRSSSLFQVLLAYKFDAVAVFKNTLETINDLNIKCSFDKLKIRDESDIDNFPKHHFELMVSKNKYPSLRTMNYRNIGLLNVPLQLKEWVRFFPKLTLIDLSYNRIKDLSFNYPNPTNAKMTLRLQYNNITKISMDIFKRWARIPGLNVDIRHNPINCTSELANLLNQLKNETAWEGPAMKYYLSHVPHLRCFRPCQLENRKLGSLSLNKLPCPVPPVHQNDLRPVLATLAVAVVLLVLLVLAVRYRREVRILVFTRAHVLLPCGFPLVNVDVDLAAGKTYDAFVAYAHEDSEWVLRELCHRLENSVTRTRPACRLCIHQRDFVVGKTIIDNIIDSIAASRHTIVVVSPSFVNSPWAMEELHQAFRQSMEERRRHLVIVMLQDVQPSNMPAVLKRCCKTFTYLEANDTLFWDRLIYSLHVTEKKKIKLGDNDVYDEALRDEGEKILDNTPIDDELRRFIFLEEMLMVSRDMMYRGVPAASEDGPRTTKPSEDAPRTTNTGVCTTNEDKAEKVRETIC